MHYDSNGLTVSGETFAAGGDPSGKNIRINSNGVNIRNGSTVLASYGESTTIGSTSGRHILIDSDSVDIKNGNTVLSQFMDSTIYLGKNSSTSTIDFCNGNGYILGRDDSEYGKGLWVHGGNRMYIVSKKELFITASDGGSNNDPHIRMEYSDSNSTLYIKSPKITIDGTTSIIGNTTISGTVNVKNTLTASGKYASSGDYYRNGALEIRENGLVTNSSTDFGYAPRIGFHWSGYNAGTLSLNHDGTFYLRKIDGTTRATLDANIQGTATNADTVDGKHAFNFFNYIGTVADLFAVNQTCVCRYDANTLNTPFKAGLSGAGAGLCFVNCEAGSTYVNYLLMPCGDRDYYAANSNNGSVSAGWRKINENGAIECASGTVGTSAVTLSYITGRTKVLLLGYHSGNQYSGAVYKTISSSMTAVSGTLVNMGNSSLKYSISSSGVITLTPSGSSAAGATYIAIYFN